MGSKLQERERERRRERKTFGTFDFIANLMGGFLFMPRREIYCTIDGDFNARINRLMARAQSYWDIILSTQLVKYKTRRNLTEKYQLKQLGYFPKQRNTKK